MELLKHLFGEGKDLNALQMSMRAVVIFIIALVLIRLAGAKTFGKNAAFDNIIVITLGAVLSRTIAGASPFIPTVCASIALVLLHRIISWLCIRLPGLGILIKGNPVSLFKNGEINKSSLDKCLLSEDDLQEGIRQQGNVQSFDKVEEAILERSGQISVIKKA